MKRLTDLELENIKQYSFCINNIDIPQLLVEYELLVQKLEEEVRWLKNDLRRSRLEYSWITP